MSATGPTAIHRRVAALRAGEDATLIARLASGWLVLGDPQLMPGYCLLLADPVVADLNALGDAARVAFLADMATAGDVLLEVLQAKRINYAIFGNLDPALHAHLFPRRADEPEALATAQPWAWDWGAAPRFDVAVHGALRAQLRARVAERTARAPRT